RLDKTYKYEGTVRANALTKRKLIQDNEPFYNSYNILEDNSFLEYLHNNNSLSWDEKVEFELSALKDTTNIWNNSFTEYSGEDKEDNETSQKPPTNIIEPEPTPDTSIQVEQTMEHEIAQDPIEKKTQDTNPLQGENDLVTPEMQMSEVLDTKDKLVAQHDNSGILQTTQQLEAMNM
ncbi:16933_t:CDS:2, partial [Gigaspora margarita]